MPTTRGRLRPLAFVPAALAGALVGGLAALLALRRLDAVEVSGCSMAPSLLPGDLLLVESISLARRPPRVGEVVLAADPRRPDRELVKRVREVRGNRVELHGDARAASTDSRSFGAVPLASVRWRVAFRYWPPARIGPVPGSAPATDPLPLEPLGGEPACSAFGDLVVAFDEESEPTTPSPMPPTGPG